MRDKQKLLDLAIHGGVLLGPTDLSRGAYSGRETYMYRNSGTYAMPTWTEKLVRIRNVQFNDGPALSDVEFHGQAFVSQIPGYKAFNGSFEYVRRRGTDATYDELKTAQEDGTIEDWVYINDDIAVDGALGWRSPIQLGEFANTSNGGDPVVETCPFGMADAYDATDAVITKVPVTTSGGVPSALGIMGVMAARAMMRRVQDIAERKQRTERIMADLAAKGFQTPGGVKLALPPREFIPDGLSDLVGKEPVATPGKPG